MEAGKYGQSISLAESRVLLDNTKELLRHFSNKSFEIVNYGPL